MSNRAAWRAALKRRIRDAYAARFRGDVDGALALFDDDVRIRIETQTEDQRSATHGVLRGRMALRDALTRQAALWDWISMTTDIRIVDDRYVVVRSVGAMRNTGGGRALITQLIDLLTMSDDVCVGIHAFIDPALSRRLFDVTADDRLG